MSAMLSQLIAAALDGPDDLAEACMTQLRVLAAGPSRPAGSTCSPHGEQVDGRIDATAHLNRAAPMHRHRARLLAPASYHPTMRECEVADLVVTIIASHQHHAPPADSGTSRTATIWIMVGDRGQAQNTPYREVPRRGCAPLQSEVAPTERHDHHVLDFQAIRLLSRAIIRAHRPRATLSLDAEHGLLIHVKGPIDRQSMDHPSAVDGQSLVYPWTRRQSSIYPWTPEGSVGALIPMEASEAAASDATEGDLLYRVEASSSWTTAAAFDQGACLLVHSTVGPRWMLAEQQQPYLLLRALWLRDVLERFRHGPIELASCWYVTLRSRLMVCSALGRLRSIPFALRRDLVQWTGIWADAIGSRPQTISEAIGTRDPSELNEYFPAPVQKPAA